MLIYAAIYGAHYDGLALRNSMTQVFAWVGVYMTHISTVYFSAVIAFVIALSTPQSQLRLPPESQR